MNQNNENEELKAVLNEQNNEVEPAGSEDFAALIADLKQKVEKNNDQALRHQAELENIKRRHSRELEKAHKYALDNMIAELLPVNDSLEMGLKASGEGVDAEKVHEGVVLTHKLLLDAMTKAGVEVLDPAGQQFNPEHHEAISMLPNPKLEPNTVMEVVQKGYLLNDRLVRPAMVVVTKG